MTERGLSVDHSTVYRWVLSLCSRTEILAQSGELRQNKYLNNLVEQDHRAIKKLVNPSLGFQSFYTARRTIMGYETMHQIRKGQILGIEKGDIQAQVEFGSQIFGVAA